MKKILTLYPYKSNFKDVFEDFNRALSSFSTDIGKRWCEYQEKYNFETLHFGVTSFENQQWKGMYEDVPEVLELWEVTGENLGVDKAMPYDEFSAILKEKEFVSPPFGTGLWLPEALREQRVSFEGELYVFALIIPHYSPFYKTVQIVLKRNENFYDGKILATLEHLRPTENLISPRTRRVVQKLLN